MRIQFLNHASVKIITERTSLTSDPWFHGPAFHNGWDLIHQDPELASVALDSDYLWISHEHPDHLSIPFFESHRPSAAVLFQATEDRRVFKYLKGRGRNVIEVADGQQFVTAPGETFEVGKFDFYDSWSLFRAEGLTILNINDCPFNEASDLERLKKKVGHVDVLLTQFSYAAWQGGRENRAQRLAAAARKLEVVKKQVEILKPAWLIPFASFTYFSHQENSYLNDAVNTIETVLESCASLPCRIVAMRPRDTWTVGEAWDNQPAREFWSAAFRNVPALPVRQSGKPATIEQLEAAFLDYRTRIYSKNSRWLIWIISRLPLINAFRPFTVRLTDLNQTFRFSFFSGFTKAESGTIPDVESCSENFLFLFKNEFGFDTLTVNGRFQATPAGFGMMTKTFAVGSLNAMGLAIRPALALRLNVVLLLLRTLHSFLKRLTSNAAPVVARTAASGD